MRVNEVMSTPPRTVELSTSASAAWETMRLHRTHHMIVTDDHHRIAGVLSASDLGGPNGATIRKGRLASDLMTKKVVVVTPETTVREAANLMRGHAVNCLPVLEGQRLAGVVTSLDLLELIGRGAERPVARTKRRILKDRGQRPQRPTAATAVGARAGAVRR